MTSDKASSLLVHYALLLRRVTMRMGVRDKIVTHDTRRRHSREDSHAFNQCSSRGTVICIRRIAHVNKRIGEVVNADSPGGPWITQQR